MSPRQQSSSLFSRALLWPALVASVRKLDPRVQLRNPVMFVVEVGALLTTFAVAYQIISAATRSAAETRRCCSPSP